MSETLPDKKRPETLLDGENVGPWLRRANELQPGFKKYLRYLISLEKRRWPYKPEVDNVLVSATHVLHPSR